MKFATSTTVCPLLFLLMERPACVAAQQLPGIPLDQPARNGGGGGGMTTHLQQPKDLFSMRARRTAVNNNNKLAAAAGPVGVLASVFGLVGLLFDQLIAIFASPRQILLYCIVNDDDQVIDSTSVSPELEVIDNCAFQAFVVDVSSSIDVPTTPGEEQKNLTLTTLSTLTQNQTSSSSSSTYYTPAPNQVAMVFDLDTEGDITNALECLDDNVDLRVFVTSLGPTTKVNRVVTSGWTRANILTYRTVCIFESSVMSLHQASRGVLSLAFVVITTLAHLW